MADQLPMSMGQDATQLTDGAAQVVGVHGVRGLFQDQPQWARIAERRGDAEAQHLARGRRYEHPAVFGALECMPTGETCAALERCDQALDSGRGQLQVVEARQVELDRPLWHEPEERMDA